MCGIAGILRVHPPGSAGSNAPPSHLDSIPESWLDLLDDSIKHRGPDGQGRFRDRVLRADGCTVDVALIHRRLSILDHKGGAQPMISYSPAQREGAGGWAPDAPNPPAHSQSHNLPLLFQGSPNAPISYKPLNPSTLLAVTFNGCIYNHRDLRKELESKGHHFTTDHSDTEVLLHGWREWREHLQEHLDGMYAFALWEQSSGSLLLARDSFGEKPLALHHVAVQGTWINLFGSVPPFVSGLVRHLGSSQVPLERHSGADDWLRFGWNVAAPIEGARAVSPGRAVFYHPATQQLPTSASAADLARLVPPSSLSRGEERHHLHGSWNRRVRTLGVDELDALIDRAVCSRLDSDVPLGCFLSGGVDSSLVAWYAKKRLGSLDTFTVEMPDPAYDETTYAKAAARAVGTNHIAVPCHAEPATDLVALIERLGLPFGDSSLLPTYWVSRAARQHVAVALSGDGGDELFAGYERYSSVTRVPMLGLLGIWIATPLRLGAKPRSTREKLARLFDASGGLGYWDIISIFPGAMLDRLIPRWPERDSRPWYRKNQIHLDSLKIAFDLNNYLPEDLLRKTDTASMHVALEVRCPFLARELADAAESATIRSLKPRHQRKGLLRAVARKYLPSEIVDRPKMGFAIPVGEWFRTDFGQMKTLLLDMLHSADPFPADVLGLELNRRFIDQMLSEHMDQRRDHSQRLYMLLVLAIWCRWLGRVRSTPTR